MKEREIWKTLPEHDDHQISDLGKIRTAENVLVEIINGWVILSTGYKQERFRVEDLIQKTFAINSEPSKNHEDILSSNNLLRFLHLVPTPTNNPNFEYKGLRIWYVADGFICVTPMRSFKQGNSKFVFPYKVAGERAYICAFDEIQPLKYRQVRNSGTVQIVGNKLPIPYRKAIGIIYKNLLKAQKAKSKWIEGKTKLKKSYINNAILNAANDIKPAVVYNYAVYTLFVDFKQLYAEYRELIPQEHIMKLYDFVLLQKDNHLWNASFGFTQNEFTNLIENCDK